MTAMIDAGQSALPTVAVRARRQESQRPRSGRAALQRWGLDDADSADKRIDDGSGPGHAGEAVRGELDVYTSEHFDADVKRRFIRPRRRKLRDRSVPRAATHCPVHHPDPKCLPGLVPRYYRSILWQTFTFEARDGERPLRDRRGKVICFDCRCWLAHQQRARFISVHGEPDRDLGYARQVLSDFGDHRDQESLTQSPRAIAERHYHYVVATAGEPEEDVDWDEIRHISEQVEYCSRAYSDACRAFGESATADGGSPEP